MTGSYVRCLHSDDGHDVIYVGVTLILVMTALKAQCEFLIAVLLTVGGVYIERRAWSA